MLRGYAYIINNNQYHNRRFLKMYTKLERGKMFNLLGCQYENTDDLIWKIKGKYVEFIKNGEFFARVSIQKLILDFISNEAHKK
jgi:hypothetical protein